MIYIAVFFRQKFNVTNDISPKLMFFWSKNLNRIIFRPGLCHFDSLSMPHIAQRCLFYWRWFDDTTFLRGFVTARKGSLWRLCFHRCLSVHGGACVARGWGVACVAGGCAWQGGMRGRSDGHCNGRYASYWNAFLFWNVPIISWHSNKAFMKRGSLK